MKIREKHAAALEEDNKILAVGLNELKIDLEQVSWFICIEKPVENKPKFYAECDYQL